jgi:FkbM family methyltransferase
MTEAVYGVCECIDRILQSLYVFNNTPLAPSMPRLSTRQKVNIAKLLNRAIRLGRSILRKPMQGEFTRNGLRWNLDLNEGIDFAIYLLGAFERDLVRCYEKLIKPGDTVLDIGANIGAHTLHMARLVGPTGRVIAIEATEYAFEKLKANLALNPELANRVIAVHSLLVADAKASAETHIYSSWPLADKGSTHPVLAGSLKSVGAARVCTVDQIVRELGLERINLIKIDVDGHELSVLQGAGHTMNDRSPKIIMEFAPYCHADKPGQFKSLIEWLHVAGYHFVQAETGQVLPNDLAHLIKFVPKGGSINALGARLIQGAG